MPEELPEGGLVVVMVEPDPDRVVLHLVRVEHATGEVLGQVTLGVRVDIELDRNCLAVDLEDQRRDEPRQKIQKICSV